MHKKDIQTIERLIEQVCLLDSYMLRIKESYERAQNESSNLYDLLEALKKEKEFFSEN